MGLLGFTRATSAAAAAAIIPRRGNRREIRNQRLGSDEMTAKRVKRVSHTRIRASSAIRSRCQDAEKKKSHE
ncbi:hypothetical protein BHM03_00020004 [Ensete ventricosum]|nr:hypothetical protein BHM03_00020004 [Ensete ventricosum]